MLDQETKNYIDQKLRDQLHDGNYSQRINLFDLFGYFETVTAVPAAEPTGGSIFAQVKIYYNSVGPAWALYVYDFTNLVWKKTALT